MMPSPSTGLMKNAPAAMRATNEPVMGLGMGRAVAIATERFTGMRRDMAHLTLLLIEILYPLGDKALSKAYQISVKSGAERRHPPIFRESPWDGERLLRSCRGLAEGGWTMAGESDRLKGKAEELGGKMREFKGEMMGEESVERQGKMEQAKGTLRQAWGELKEKAEDIRRDIQR